MRACAWLLLTALAISASCGPAVQVTEREVDVEGEGLGQSSELSVSLRLFVITDQGERAVADGERLRSGDRIFALVRSNQPAYLHAVMFAPDGSTSVLYPEGDKNGVRPDCRLRIPQLGSLYLQDPTGVENLHIAASLRPLSQADRRLCEQLHLPCAELAAKPLHPGDCMDARQPKGQKQRAVLERFKLGKAAGNGVVTLRLPFQHDP